eukprot:g5305.t1
MNLNDNKERLFLCWLLEHGAYFPKIKYPWQNSRGIRGAIAREDIKVGDILLSIPEKLLITPQVCLKSPRLANVYLSNVDLFSQSEDLVLSLFIMNEYNRGDSFYAPYLNQLPPPSTISVWHPDELKELQDDSLVKEGNLKEQKIREQYDKLITWLEEKFPRRFPRQCYDYETFHWAWHTVQARAFGRRLSSTTLVPLADNLNHGSVAVKYKLCPQDVHNTDTFKGEDSKMFFHLYSSGLHGSRRRHRSKMRKLRSLLQSETDRVYLENTDNENPRDQSNKIENIDNSVVYKKGEEVLNSYGRRSNRFLLLEYGFALPNNEHDSVSITAKLYTDDALFVQKRSLLSKKYGRRIHTDKLFLGCPCKVRWNRLCNDLLAFYRVVFIDEKVIRSDRYKKWHTEPLGLSNEMNAVVASIEVLRDWFVQSTSQTTISEDKEIIKALSDKRDQTSVRLVSAVQYRLSRKNIVKQQIHALKAIQELLTIRIEARNNEASRGRRGTGIGIGFNVKKSGIDLSDIFKNVAIAEETTDSNNSLHDKFDRMRFTQWKNSSSSSSTSSNSDEA